MPVDATIPYLAGFFDGEGHVMIVRQKYQHRTDGFQYVLIVGATQYDKTPLEMFQSEFGGNIYRRCSKNDNPIYEWRAVASVALGALETLLPYLVVKRDQAVVGIRFQKRKVPRNTPLSDHEKLLNEDDLIILREIRREIRESV